MEKAQTKQHFVEFLWLIAAVEPLLVKAQVRSQQGLLQSLWRLNGHFDTHLQNRNWKRRRWTRCQPESEVLIHAVRIELFDN